MDGQRIMTVFVVARQERTGSFRCLIEALKMFLDVVFLLSIGDQVSCVNRES